ncbi:MAG: SurA N-terminal domain-containing protein [Myxococcales bacterium]|nr:SurA N-terminal domain-containing protein [Myxococcales bacterium]
MLEQLRKSGASIAIYLIFGLLIIIFVINFAPNAGQGKGGGCTGPGNSAITVGTAKTSQSAYHVAYAANKYNGRQKVYAALEMLIRRELLADAASDAGIRVTNDLVETEMKKGYFFYAGFRIPDFAVDPQGGPVFVSEHSFFDLVDGEQFFNFGKFKGWVGSLNVSVGSYYDEQARAMQAALMSELITDSVRVSRDEAMTDYLFAHNTVSYDTVTFTPTAYRDAMRLGDADVARFLAGHEADVKKKYTDEERTYKGTNPALKLRSIKIDLAKAEAKPAEAPPADPSKPADPAKPADGAKGADATKPGEAKPAVTVSDANKPGGSGLTVTEVTPGKKPEDVAKAGAPAAKPTGMAVAEAKAKLEAARTAIAAGKQKFADAAKQLTTDEATKFNGGDVGWRSVENAGLGDPAINDAVKALKPGEMTAVVIGESAAYLVIAEDKRQGDLSFDQVKSEIAAELARDLWSKEAAKRAALDALTTARAGNAKNLGDMFERGVNEREQQRRMEQMIEEQYGQQHGALETPKAEDVPASWRAGDDQAVGGGSSGSAGSAAPAAGSAAPAPATGSAGSAASGSAAPAAGAGSGSGSAPTTEPAPLTVVTLAPSTDVLPPFGEIKKPKAIPQSGIPREKEMPGLEGIKEASATLFDELQAGMLGKKVYETPEGFVLIQLTEKTAPKVEDFDKVADKELAKLRALRGRMAVEGWLKNRCEALAKDGKIVPTADLVHESDDAGKPLPQVYRPCMSFR